MPRRRNTEQSVLKILLLFGVNNVKKGKRYSCKTFCLVLKNFKLLTTIFTQTRMRRAKNNVRKHRVSFTEAVTVFDDLLSIVISDPDHSDEEERWLLIGESNRLRLLVVIYTEKGNRIRLISARRATKAERRTYEKG